MTQLKKDIKKKLFQEQVLSAFHCPPELFGNNPTTCTEVSMVSSPITRKDMKLWDRMLRKYQTSFWNHLAYGLMMTPLQSAACDIWYLGIECNRFPITSVRFLILCRLRQIWASFRFHWYYWKKECESTND